ncbi:MAG: GrpB family protein, partial [Ilumatobacteraceae bacterium]
PPAGEEVFVNGGPHRESVDIVAYDDAWPAEYALVAERIRDVLDTQMIGLDHIGSTSVPGLPAKATIDIDLTVTDSSDESAYVLALQSVGFRLVIRERGWHEHRLFTLDKPRVNLHVFSPECPEVIRHRMFRDWLIEHPEDRDRYRRAKLEAAAGARSADESVTDYNQRKQPAIREIYARMFCAHGLL